MRNLRATLDTVPDFYRGYVNHVKHLGLQEALLTSIDATTSLLGTLAESQGDFRYQPGKWSIKELLNHMLDAERIFAYRALRFSRRDETELPGWEENDYASVANAHARTLNQLGNELIRLRATTVDLYNSFTEEMLLFAGTANNTRLSVFQIGYIIAGHETHHRLILQERYLKN